MSVDNIQDIKLENINGTNNTPVFDKTIKNADKVDIEKAINNDIEWLWGQFFQWGSLLSALAYSGQQFSPVFSMWPVHFWGFCFPWRDGAGPVPVVWFVGQYQAHRVFGCIRRPLVSLLLLQQL